MKTYLDLPSIIAAVAFVTLVYIMFIGYIVSEPPAWWKP